MAASVIGASPDVLATQFNTVHAAYWGDLFHATGTVANQGTATTTAPIPVEIYASTSPILGDGGIVDGSARHGVGSGWSATGGLVRI